MIGQEVLLQVLRKMYVLLGQRCVNSLAKGIIRPQCVIKLSSKSKPANDAHRYDVWLPGDASALPRAGIYPAVHDSFGFIKVSLITLIKESLRKRKQVFVVMQVKTPERGRELCVPRFAPIHALLMI